MELKVLFNVNHVLSTASQHVEKTRSQALTESAAIRKGNNMDIGTYTFSISGRQQVEENPKGKDWPVVYMIHNESDLYIGETTSACYRMNQHLQDPKKNDLRKIRIIFDESFNKSVILDFEQKLIKYCMADKKFNVRNKNLGQSSSHNYFDRARYYDSFKELWNKLRQLNMVKKPIDAVENENIFKFSPYNSLTEEQNAISTDIINDICDCFENKKEGISLVNGCAGTGKTVLAISLINSLVNAVNLDEAEIDEESANIPKVQALLRLKRLVRKRGSFTIGFVFPMIGIRKTIQSVFNNFGNGLSGNMVIGPSDLIRKDYDILIVDEAHRLCRRRNIVNMSGFDKTCESLGLDKGSANQLDWVLKKSRFRVLFYDQDQTIKASDISYDEFECSLMPYDDVTKKYELKSQMRCQGGDAYIDYVKRIFNGRPEKFEPVMNYDFRLFDDVDEMVSEIKRLNEEYGLCRNVAGYSWKWVTDIRKPLCRDRGIKTYEQIRDAGLYDIDICGHKYIWNLKTEGWILREDAVNTIGCIHTTQGFDLNCVGVIFGEEIDYDPRKMEITVDLEKFHDTNVKRGTDPDVVKQYVINTYVTMMARGIHGCYVYACNKNLREYLAEFIPKHNMK